MKFNVVTQAKKGLGYLLAFNFVVVARMVGKLQ